MINRFILGDAFADDGLFALPADAVDHTVFDPPYNDHVHGGNRRGWETDTDGVSRPTKPMPMQFGAWSEEDAAVCALEVVRVTKGWVLCFCALEDVGMWKRVLVEAGAKRRNTMVWTKSSTAPKFAGDGPAAAAEAIVTAWAGKGASVWNAGGGYGHYHYPSDRLDRRHETQKPLALMRQLILDFTMPDQIILDPTAGGGATLIAAHQLGRRWLGWERGGTPELEVSYRAGLAMLERTEQQTMFQSMGLHKLRRHRAYAGAKLKQTAISTQAEQQEFDLKAPRRRAVRIVDL